MYVDHDMKISREDLLSLSFQVMGWMQIFSMFFGPSQVGHAVVCVKEQTSVGDSKCVQLHSVKEKRLNALSKAKLNLVISSVSEALLVMQ